MSSATATPRKQIKCGHCSTFHVPRYHGSLADVRACAQQEYQGKLALDTPPVAQPEVVPAISIKGDVVIPDGVYTVVFEGGDYRTLQVETQEADADFAPGERIISYLSGPDNTSSYTGFAFLKSDGRVIVWKRFRSDEHSALIEAARVLVADPRAASAAYGIASKHCGICGRPLSTPASLDRGIGPKCAENQGW